MTEVDVARDTLGHLRYIKVPVGDYMSLTQRAKGKRRSEEPKEMRWIRNGFWTGAALLGGAGLVLTAGRIEGWFAPDTSIIVWSIALMLLSAVFAVVVQMTINKQVMIAEIRDARPADNIALGEMKADLEANRELIRQMREEMAANELQRQADFDQIRDNSRKALDGLHQQVERLAAGVELAVLKAQRKAYAAGVRDVIDEIERHRTERRRDGALADEPTLYEEIQQYLRRQVRDDEE